MHCFACWLLAQWPLLSTRSAPHPCVAILTFLWVEEVLLLLLGSDMAARMTLTVLWQT